MATTQGYVSGQSKFAEMTFTSATFSSLGMNSSGAHTWILPQNTVTLIICSAPTSQVPLPTALPL